MWVTLHALVARAIRPAKIVPMQRALVGALNEAQHLIARGGDGRLELNGRFRFMFAHAKAIHLLTSHAITTPTKAASRIKPMALSLIPRPSKHPC